MKIFISYAHADEEQVREVVEILRDDANHDVWFDPRLVAGKAWEDQLLDAIKDSDCFLYALTPESAASKWCQWEFAQAVHAKKPVVPVKMQANVTFGGILDVLNRVQYVDFSQGATRRAVAKLVSSVAAAECISPEDVPLFDAPHAKPERPVEQKIESKSLADELYQEALALYKRKKYKETWDLLADCLFAEPNHEDAQKLMSLVERKIEKPKPTEPKSAPKPTVEKVLQKGKTGKLTIVRLEEILPGPFEWSTILAGDVTLTNVVERGGSKGGKYQVETFQMAKYPITNAQYQAFVEADDGYRQPMWWSYSIEAQQWRKQNARAIDTAFGGDDLPRTNVCWFEAVAFCLWLGQKTGQSILLPTEQQWQRAAQGDDQWDYPWGDELPTHHICNFERRIMQPTPVTRYPEGASPYGVMDMSGNVWEWCLTIWGTDSASLQAIGRRILRGGSWFNDYNYARCTFRENSNPAFRDNYIGFRIARFQ